MWMQAYREPRCAVRDEPGVREHRAPSAGAQAEGGCQAKSLFPRYARWEHTCRRRPLELRESLLRGLASTRSTRPLAVHPSQDPAEGDEICCRLGARNARSSCRTSGLARALIGSLPRPLAPRRADAPLVLFESTTRTKRRERRRSSRVCRRKLGRRRQGRVSLCMVW